MERWSGDDEALPQCQGYSRWHRMHHAALRSKCVFLFMPYFFRNVYAIDVPEDVQKHPIFPEQGASPRHRATFNRKPFQCDFHNILRQLSFSVIIGTSFLSPFHQVSITGCRLCL